MGQCVSGRTLWIVHYKLGYERGDVEKNITIMPLSVTHWPTTILVRAFDCVPDLKHKECFVCLCATRVLRVRSTV